MRCSASQSGSSPAGARPPMRASSLRALLRPERRAEPLEARERVAQASSRAARTPLGAPLRCAPSASSVRACWNGIGSARVLGERPLEPCERRRRGRRARRTAGRGTVRAPRAPRRGRAPRARRSHRSSRRSSASSSSPTATSASSRSPSSTRIAGSRMTRSRSSCARLRCPTAAVGVAERELDERRAAHRRLDAPRSRRPADSARGRSRSVSRLIDPTSMRGER